MSLVTLRSEKGEELTHEEMDANFTVVREETARTHTSTSVPEESPEGVKAGDTWYYKSNEAIRCSFCWVPKYGDLNWVYQKDGLKVLSAGTPTSILDNIDSEGSSGFFTNYYTREADIHYSLVSCLPLNYNVDEDAINLDVIGSVVTGSIVLNETYHIYEDDSVMFNAAVIAGGYEASILNHFYGLSVGDNALILNPHCIQQTVDLEETNLGNNSSGKVTIVAITQGDNTPVGENVDMGHDNKIYFPKLSITRLKGTCATLDLDSGESLTADIDLSIKVTEAGVISIVNSDISIIHTDVAAWTIYTSVTNNDAFCYLTLGINGEAGGGTLSSTFAFDYTQIHTSEDASYRYYYKSS